jgi:hypothetical protein
MVRLVGKMASAASFSATAPARLVLRRANVSSKIAILGAPFISCRCAGPSGSSTKAAVRRARGGAGLSVALYPPRRHRQQPPDRLRPAACHLQVEGYRIKGRDRYRSMRLATDEFIRRFLIHVLPKGLHRIRHYGLSLKPLAPATSHAPASCSPPQNLRVNPPAPWSIPAILLVHATAVA